jgi:cardiolipin synthase
MGVQTEAVPLHQPTPDGGKVPAESWHVQVAGHELRIFVESMPLIRAMVEDIRAAKERVWLEAYIFLDDAAGREVAEALKDRATAGLDVRVLYDALGSVTTAGAFFRDLEQAGVKVHAFHSLWEAFRRSKVLRILNRRNHRKLLIVDDTAAYFGGMNVVDQSSMRTIEHAERVPTSAGWRDVHVRLAGPQLGEVAESFDRSWRRAHGHRVSRRPLAYRQAQLVEGSETIQFFDSGPGLTHTRAARVFNRLIRRATRTLTLSMAYFLPVGRVLRELLGAHRRGVLIRVVVPGQSDVKLVQHATRYLYRQLLRRRFHIFERQIHMLHSKVMVVDGEWAVVGSSNLDARSLWINHEFLAVVHSRTFAKTLNEIIKYEIERSERITLRSCLRLTRWQRLMHRLAWSLRWWL